MHCAYFASASPYPEPVYTGWSSVHWNAIRMPLVDPVYTGIPLGDPSNIAEYTGIPLEKFSWDCPTLECHWRNYCSLHWNTTGGTITAPTHPGTHSSTHASLKWQDSGTASGKWTALCKFRFYLEFTVLQCIPVLLLKGVSTSTSLYACLGYEHHYNFCVFGVAV